MSEAEIFLSIGRRLLCARRRRGMTQAQVARLVGVHFQQIAKYECGECNIPVARLVALGRALDVPAGDFVNGL